MARDDPHFRLRIPEALKAQVEAAAKANNRSMNAEIVSRLERSFDMDDKVEELDATLLEQDRRLDRLESQVSDLRYRAGIDDWNDRD